MIKLRSKICKFIPMMHFSKCTNKSCIVAGSCTYESSVLDGLNKEDVKYFNNMYKNNLRNFGIIKQNLYRQREKQLKMTGVHTEFISKDSKIKE